MTKLNSEPNPSVHPERASSVSSLSRLLFTPVADPREFLRARPGSSPIRAEASPGSSGKDSLSSRGKRATVIAREGRLAIMLRYFRVLLLGGVIGSANVQAQLVNGDFASGDLTAWTASAVNQAGASVSPLIDVVPAGAENVARFMTGLFGSGPFISTLNQSFTISAAAPLLVFEFSLPSSVLDNSGTGNSQFSDSFTASLHNGVSTMSLLVVDKFGPVADPFGAAPGPVTLGQVQGPVYQYSFSADLSAMAGSTVSLFYDVSSADDGLASTFNLGGVELSSSDPKIPEPNTWRLFGLIGIAALGARLFKQKRATL